jgi:hypothetical protein
MPGRASRHMSVVHHGLLHEPLTSATGSVAYDGDTNRLSVVSSLVPASVAIATR